MNYFRRLITRLRPLPPIPFAPFHEEHLTALEVRRALADRGDDKTVRAVFQLIQGNMRVAVRDMAIGNPEGRGAWLALEQLWTELANLVRRPEDPKEPAG